MEKLVLVIEKNFCEFKAKGYEFAKLFEITKTIYSNSKKADQFWKQNTFYWQFSDIIHKGLSFDDVTMMSRLHQFGCFFVPLIFESYKVV